jgi:hypothetical protein
MMYPSTVQSIQKDGRIRNFLKLPSKAPIIRLVASEPKVVESFPEESMNLELLREVIDKIPSVTDMNAFAQLKGRLRAKLDEIDDLIFPFLHWLVVTNGAHLRLLKEEERFPGYLFICLYQCKISDIIFALMRTESAAGLERRFNLSCSAVLKRKRLRFSD